jgi:hypothetical protein
MQNKLEFFLSQTLPCRQQRDISKHGVINIRLGEVTKDLSPEQVDLGVASQARIGIDSQVYKSRDLSLASVTGNANPTNTEP